MNPSQDFQKFYANISQNSLDFSPFLDNILLLSKQVAGLIQNSFQSLGMNPQLDMSSILNQTKPSLNPYKNPSTNPFERKIPTNTIIPPLMLNKEPAIPQLLKPKLSTKPIIPSFQPSTSIKTGVKRPLDCYNEAIVKLENECLVPKKVKTHILTETASDSTSEGSLDHSENKVKLEETTVEKKEAILQSDKVVKIKGMKIDKKTKKTHYLVEWKRRGNGYKPEDSYIQSEEILKDYGHLVAMFYEGQIKQKING